MVWFWQKKRSEDLQELWDAIRTLTRKLDDKDLDWSDMRARCKRLLDRTEKAARRVDEGVPSAESPNAAPDGEASTNGLPTGRLTDHQKQIQQLILRRRGGL